MAPLIRTRPNYQGRHRYRRACRPCPAPATSTLIPCVPAVPARVRHRRRPSRHCGQRHDADSTALGALSRGSAGSEQRTRALSSGSSGVIRVAAQLTCSEADVGRGQSVAWSPPITVDSRTVWHGSGMRSPLTRSALPLDLRHACVSCWLRSGVSHAKTARRAGQSIAVLQRYYAKVLDGEEDRMNELIDQDWPRTVRKSRPMATMWPHAPASPGIPARQSETPRTAKGRPFLTGRPFAPTTCGGGGGI